MAPHDEEFDLRVTTLAELGANTHVPAKIRVFVDEDRLVYTNVGRTTDEIAQLLG